MDRIALFAIISIFFPTNPTSKGKAIMEVGEGSNMNPTSNEKAMMEAGEGYKMNPTSNEKAMMEAGEGSNMNPTSNEEASLEEMNNGGNLPAQDDQAPQVEEDKILGKIETIMRRILPHGTVIEDDGTKEMMRGCMSEFVQYIIREAEKETQNASRRVIRTNDILSAMQKVGFSNYIDPVTAHLEERRNRKQARKRNKGLQGHNAGSSSK